jgi:hypothetical protein
MQDEQDPSIRVAIKREKELIPGDMMEQRQAGRRCLFVGGWAWWVMRPWIIANLTRFVARLRLEAD